MSTNGSSLGPNPESGHAWHSLVERSIVSWKILRFQKPDGTISRRERRLEAEFLHSYGCLDDFLLRAPEELMFWFFQRREAFLGQTSINKWNQDRLEDYILIPATIEMVNRNDCFFLSHFWQSKDHPDPDGHYLRCNQAELSTQEWSYIWVDWTCVPQAPRRSVEEKYFKRTLATVSGIIRNSGFAWYYPPFEARMWILYEVAEYTLTCSNAYATTPDIQIFVDHVEEMVKDGVSQVLSKYKYRCTFDHDRVFLTSWLELLVLLRRAHVDVDDLKRLMDHLTWHPTCQHIIAQTANGLVELNRFGGELTIAGIRQTFTPFPLLT